VVLTRKFVDSEGVHWQVYELSNDSSVEANPAESWLYFFSRDTTRSLSPYPDDWSMMDWPGLEGLCRRARPPAVSLARTPDRPESTTTH
jgi:NADH:ubiquinone oxidoreductase subunit